MSSLDRAAQLRAEADDIEAEAFATLKADLLAAKAAYADDPSEENKAAKNDAALKLRAARAASRPETPAVGGDAYVIPDEPAESVTDVTGQEV